jgi:hypothetical protein
MSFSVALQSAVFYFVACTPCAKVRHRQKARQQAKKEREEKARIEADQPGLYRHPSPFNTNPYWAEEITMGPSLSKKGKSGDGGSKNASQRGLTSAGKDSSIGTRSSLAISQAATNIGTVTNETATSAEADSSAAAEEDRTSTTLSKTGSMSTGDDWNFKRYQREDEELWGHEFAKTGHKLMDAIKQAGTSAGRFVEAKLGKEKPITDEDRHNFYLSPKNPPVNDYHPPVVSSKPAHRDGHRWMLQPPPPAKVMEGKVPVSRSGSLGSVSSRKTSTPAEGLGRLVGEKSVEARIRKGESTQQLARPPVRKPGTESMARSKSQRTARSRSVSVSADSDASDEGGDQKPRRKARRNMAVPPAADMSEESNQDGDKESATRRTDASTTLPAHAAQRPRLETIVSSEATEPSDSTSWGEKSQSATPLRTLTNLAVASAS